MCVHVCLCVCVYVHICLSVCVYQAEVYSDRPNVFISQCSAESPSLISAPGCLSAIHFILGDYRSLLCKAAAHSSQTIDC